MNDLKQSLHRIPWWAFLLVALVIFVNVVYLHYKFQIPASGSVIDRVRDQWVYQHVPTGSPAEKAGLKAGDTLISVNSFTMEQMQDRPRGKAGDTVQVKIKRNGWEMALQLVYQSRQSEYSWFLITMAVVMSLLSVAGLYVLNKKPEDKAVRLFFLVMVSFGVCHNAIDLPFPEPLASFVSFVFFLGVGLLQPFLIHFHLLFPEPLKLFARFPRIPQAFYLAGLVIGVWFFIAHMRVAYWGYNQYGAAYVMINRIALWWIAFTYFIALTTALYQYRTNKDTLARIQLRLVIFGSFFALIAPIIYAFLFNYINDLMAYFPLIMELFSELGSLILVICCLLAIFRYRIWNTEIVFRKALLYLAATMVIAGSYLMMIYLADRFTVRETTLTRFGVITVSVIVFLLFRDRIQRSIDRLFNRESYDSAKVVSEFEEKLSGVYEPEALKEKISQGLDDIFHYKSFVLGLRTANFHYEPAYVIGVSPGETGAEIAVNTEFEIKLDKATVFSPGELNEKLPFLEMVKGELVVPLRDKGRPAGFLICGQKRSERIYSMQDIRVLSLLAKRIVALFNTATLHRKDLDRQLMLERERARISQDMHDDVGASLTRISILSELARNRTDVTGETRQWLGQISDTSRGVMEEMNQIIWALNPRNDTLEGLVAYIRRFASEYLEPTEISYAFGFPETLPDLPLRVEVRRNIYLCVREALHNLVKHSGAREVHISLAKNEHRFKITVKDNGRGFDTDHPEKAGNGLFNMKKRMNEIGGEFQIVSKPGEGTEINLIVPAGSGITTF